MNRIRTLLYRLALAFFTMQCLQQRSMMRGSSSAARVGRTTVQCRVFSNWPKKGDSEGANPGPPDAPRKVIQEEIIAEGREWLETILSRFGPIKERASTVTTLDFEKPLLELDKRIKEVTGGRPSQRHSWPSARPPMSPI